MRQQRMDFANWLIEIRLKLKEGTQSTLERIRFSETLIVPMWVTKADSPFGRFTNVFKVVVIEVKTTIEWTMWSVALVSMT